MSGSIASTSCRSVGPGGTTVEMFATPEGVKCVWTNNSCPYELDDVTVDGNDEASDGHNVSFISWDDIAALAALMPAR